MNKGTTYNIILKHTNPKIVTDKQDKVALNNNMQMQIIQEQEIKWWDNRVSRFIFKAHTIKNNVGAIKSSS